MQGGMSPYTVVTGFHMQESEEGVLGTRDALLAIQTDGDRHWSSIGPGGVWIEFDLGTAKPVKEIRIWNYKQNRGYGLTRRGMRNVKITYSPSEDLAAWQELG